MEKAVLLAMVAAIGNMLQGCDNAAIAGAVLYIKREFNLEAQPSLEGFIVSMSLIGATIVTTFAGPLADRVGRRPMLIASSLLYFAAGVIMFWSPNVHVFLLARLVDGFGVGLAVTIVPVYISETAPTEIRGLLNTLPQFTGSLGMFATYCVVFLMTLSPHPNWRCMLGALSLPSLLYLALTVLYLPESPRWLVSKGLIEEATDVLRWLRDLEDVDLELALLVEGTGSRGRTTIEEYVLGPTTASSIGEEKQERVTLYGLEQRPSRVVQPVPSGRGSTLGNISSRHGSSVYQQMKDPVVTLLGSVHEKMSSSEAGLRSSALLPNLGSMLGVAERTTVGGWDEENVPPPDDEEQDTYLSEEEDDEAAAVLRKPLLSRRSTDMVPDETTRCSGLTGDRAETASTAGIGGGWQLAWKWTVNVGADDVQRRGIKRMYMYEDEAATGPGEEYVHALALVSQSMIYSEDTPMEQSKTSAFANASKTAAKKAAGPWWQQMMAPGVRNALLCGMLLQILQQFSGINGVLYYTPQILEQAGVGVLLSSLGLSTDSTSILISGVTTLLMMPSICVAMVLMDVSGRRRLLLCTIPVLMASLGVLIVANVVPMAATAHAALSTGSVIVYLCLFVMGFGPIPNILCAEIFPTRVRVVCIAVCALTFWMCDIAVTYSLPVMLASVGLVGVFGLYAAVCVVALVFVALKVPETKGMPLELIPEFFKVKDDYTKEAEEGSQQQNISDGSSQA